MYGYEHFLESEEILDAGIFGQSTAKQLEQPRALPNAWLHQLYEIYNILPSINHHSNYHNTYQSQPRLAPGPPGECYHVIHVIDSRSRPVPVPGRLCLDLDPG